jgi:chorismate mutase
MYYMPELNGRCKDMSDKRLYGIRGAVCAENTADSVFKAVDTLCSRVFAENALQSDDIVSIQFTLTADLTALNPAAALRKSSIGEAASKCALFCSAEPPVAGSLSRVIRLLITAYLPEGAKPIHLYTGGAEVLRPDLAGMAGKQ